MLSSEYNTRSEMGESYSGTVSGNQSIYRLTEFKNRLILATSKVSDLDTKNATWNTSICTFIHCKVMRTVHIFPPL